jgi:hypothetical protein
MCLYGSPSLAIRLRARPTPKNRANPQIRPSLSADGRSVRIHQQSVGLFDQDGPTPCRINGLVDRKLPFGSPNRPWLLAVSPSAERSGLMAHEIAKLLLEHAGTFLERSEAVKTALELGMPLDDIQSYLDWLDAVRGPLTDLPPRKLDPNGKT